MKELVEHIRAVHFALAVGSVALLAAGLSRPSVSATQALADATLLKSLSETQSEFEASIHDRLAKEIPKAQELDLPFTPRTPPGSFLTQYEPWIEVKSTGKVFASGFPGWFFVKNRANSQPDTFQGLSPWNSLDDFVRYWDGAPTFFVVEQNWNPDNPLSLSGNDVLSCKDRKDRGYIILDKPREASGEIQYTVEPDPAEFGPYVKGHLDVDGTDCTANFAVRLIEIRQLIAEKLQELAKQDSLTASTQIEPIADFRVTFHDLDSLTVHTKRLPWEDLIPEIQQNVNESRSPIEMWGAKIPAWLGIVMLLGTQLYLVLHCEELRSLAVSASDPLPTGYIGLYQQPAARLLAATTLTVLPIAAIFLVLERDHRALWVTLSATLVSTILGGYCVYLMNTFIRSDRLAVGTATPSSGNESANQESNTRPDSAAPLGGQA